MGADRRAASRPGWWDRLDPQVAELLQALDDLGLAPTESLTPAQARAQWSQPEPEPPLEGLASASDLLIPGPAGPVRVRIYLPAATALRPLLVYFHGGGFVIDSIETHDGLCRRIARDVPCAVASVDYRLAPEHPYPAAADDAYAATCWLVAHAHEFGCDVTRVGVGGDSAGGNLAIGVALRARDGGGPALCFQWLAYPVVDLSRLDRQSYVEFGDCRALTAEEMAWYRGHYLPDLTRSTEPLVSPLLAASLAGLPPTFIMTAEVDVLRDEAAEFAERLAEAGVAVEYVCSAGMVHAYLGMLGMVDAVEDHYAGAVDALRRGLGVAPAEQRPLPQRKRR